MIQWIKCQWLMKLGRVQQFRNHYEAASDYYRKATALRLDCGLAYAKLGYCLYKLGRSRESIDAYERAFSIDSNFAALLYISLSLSSLGDSRTATEYMDRAFRNCSHLRNPANAAWWRNELGCMYATLGDWSRAAENFQLSADGRASASTYFNLAVAFRNLGETDRCMNAFKKAIELDPKDAGANYSLGRVLLALDRNADAIAHLRRAAKLDTNHANARYLLGIALAEVGQLTESVEQLEIAEQLRPEDEDTHSALERVRTKLRVRT